MAKIKGVYQTIFLNSWKDAWRHKEVWLIALIAGFANTGAVFNSVIKMFWRVRPADDVTIETLKSTLDFLPWVSLYTEHLISSGTARIIITIAAILAICIILAVLIIGAQQMLISAVFRFARKRKSLNAKGLFKELRHLHFWRIAAVDTLIYIFSLITASLSSLALAWLLKGSAGLDLLSFAAVYTVSLPIIFLINTLGMFMLINIVRHNKGIVQAFSVSINAIKRNWLAAFEVALGLFVANLITSSALVIALIIYAIPVFTMIVAATNVESFLLISIISFLGSLGALLIIMLYAGIITTFNYAVWTNLLERLERFGVVPVIEKIAGRILKPFNRT